MCLLTAKREFRAPRRSASQASAAAGSCGRQCTWKSSRILLVQSQLVTHQTSRTWIHIRLLLDRVLSNLADFGLQSALTESQGKITELKDIVVKKLSDYKPDNPRLGFCDFLRDSYDDSYGEFQQETFNLLMRLKCRDKQQQRYQC